ncbi:hypothetical protein JZU68_02335, partial [bacterium]|nr:hypothetical protein [bacterium]
MKNDKKFSSTFALVYNLAPNTGRIFPEYAAGRLFLTSKLLQIIRQIYFSVQSEFLTNAVAVGFDAAY